MTRYKRVRDPVTPRHVESYILVGFIIIIFIILLFYRSGITKTVRTAGRIATTRS